MGNWPIGVRRALFLFCYKYIFLLFSISSCLYENVQQTVLPLTNYNGLPFRTGSCYGRKGFNCNLVLLQWLQIEESHSCFRRADVHFSLFVMMLFSIVQVVPINHTMLTFWRNLSPYNNDSIAGLQIVQMENGRHTRR